MSSGVPAYLMGLLGRSPGEDRIADELLRLGAEIMRHDEFFFASATRFGMSFRFHLTTKQEPLEEVVWCDLVISTIHLHRGGHEEFCEYPDDLPLGLRFGDDISSLVRLREPDESGGGIGLRSDRLPIPRWRKWYIGDVSVHAQFSDSGPLEMVTLATRAGS